MPVVPTADGPQVKSNVTPVGPTARVDAPNLVLPDFQLPQIAPLRQQQKTFTPKDPFTSAYEPVQPLMADTAAQNEAGWAKAFGAAGDEIGDIVNRVQLQTNALLTDNAVNQAKEAALRLAYDKDTGFTSLKGFDALNRPDGKPLADEYADKFDQVAQDISENYLKNDKQRAAFQEQAQGIRSSLYGQATQHETQEFRNYNQSTQEGTIKTETDNIGLNYKDPDAVGNSVERIRGAVAEQGIALGKSHTWIEAAQQDAVSKAHSMAIDSALEDGNVVFADAYMRAHKAEMNPQDILRTRGVITKEMDGRMGLAAAKDAIGSVTPAIAGGTDMDRVQAITMKAESGGNDVGADGKVLTSPKGAQGKMQVMPTTQTDPGFGVTPAKDDSLAEKARVGRDYMAAMIQRYNGDLPQAWAAYNWGPGHVDDALKTAQKSGGNWFDAVPDATRKYVTDNMAAYGSGAGKPAMPTLEDALAKLDADPRVNSSPTRLDYARREVTSRYEAMVKAKKQGDDDGYATALQGVEANGGNFMGLSPATRAAIPAEKVKEVMEFADKVRSGNTVTNLAVYQKLTDDNVLKGMNDSQFYGLRPELSPSDFQHFSDQRAKLLGEHAGAGQGPGDLNTPAIRMVVENRLQTLGINPTPKANDPAGMARVGAVNKYVREQILLGQQQAGKKFDDAQTEAYIDTLFSKSVPFRNTVLGITVGHSAERMLEMTPGDVPGDARDAITNAFKKRGIPNPTDADILTAYWRTKTLGH